jgi:hypothetical protein
MSLVGGEKHHGIHRCWISVMVPIDVTNFYAGCQRREVLGFYMNILHEYFLTDIVIFNNGNWQGEFCYFCRDSWNLSYLTPIVSIHVVGWGKGFVEGIISGWLLKWWEWGRWVFCRPLSYDDGFLAALFFMFDAGCSHSICFLIFCFLQLVRSLK